MSLRHSPPRIAPVVVLTVDPDDHVELRRRIPLAAPGRPDLLVHLHPLKPVQAQLPAHVGGIVVVAPRSTALVHRVVEFCDLARARSAPSILVRWAELDDDAAWPSHPVNVAVDVAADRRHDVLDVLVRAFLEQAPIHLPVAHDSYAALALLHGDERRAAFVKALQASGRDHRVLAVDPPEAGAQHGPALYFAPRGAPPSSTGLYPLEEDWLDRDPRRYALAVDPPDDVVARATAIAALHVAHGDWRATLAAVEACAAIDGDVDGASDLLVELSKAMCEPGVLLHRTLVARADAMTTSRAPSPPPSRSFWARVDAKLERNERGTGVGEGGPLVC